MMSRIAYHLQELAIAQDPHHAQHALPVFPPDVQAVLDVGCGIGQLLVAAKLPEQCLSVGVDIDADMLAYGKQHFPEHHFLQASVQQMPFTEHSFDMVASRVCLPYTELSQSLSELHRVLRPEGQLWITLHPWQFTWRQWSRALRSGNLKELIFRSYVFGNGLCLHFFGTVFRFPLNRQRIESFQTEKGMRRLLRKRGFGQICCHRGNCFAITATRK